MSKRCASVRPIPLTGSDLYYKDVALFRKQAVVDAVRAAVGSVAHATVCR